MCTHPGIQFTDVFRIFCRSGTSLIVTYKHNDSFLELHLPFFNGRGAGSTTAVYKAVRVRLTVGIRGSAQELEKLESEFGPKTGPRIKTFYTRSIPLVLN